jgi:predicted permease
MIFDFGNSLLVFTFVYSIACQYGDQRSNAKIVLKKLLSSSPIWALITGSALNLSGIRIHQVGIDFLRVIGHITVPLTRLSLGIYFSPKITRVVPLICANPLSGTRGFHQSRNGENRPWDIKRE